MKAYDNGIAKNGDPAHTVILNDTKFLEELRLQMLKFATLQLSDRVVAEDAVQEALMGALKNAQSFVGRAALKTWVFAILKNKIADTLRQRQRLIDVEQLIDPDEEIDEFTDLFNDGGYWREHEHPIAWGTPESSIQDQHFWRVFDACLEHLPGQQAQIFMMREFIEMDTKEICAETGVTETNLNVILYRARVRLRECLESKWFARGIAHV